MRAGMRSALAAAALFWGCAQGPQSPAPQEVALGVDACEYCHMALDDPRRAAQWVEEGGLARKFDEPGCLVAWLQRRPEARGAAFVADEEGGGWVRAEEAAFVRGGARTGMGFDVLAFRDAGAAAERAARTPGSGVEDWSTLRRRGVKDVHAH